MPDTTTWVLVDPIARVRSQADARPAGRRAGPLRTVGFFSNSKQHAAEIQRAMAEAVSRGHHIETRFYRKPNASVAAAPDLLEVMAAECDAVFTGSAD